MTFACINADRKCSRYFPPDVPIPHAYHDEHLNERADRLRAQFHTSVKAGRTNLVDALETVALVENSSADLQPEEDGIYVV